MISKTSNNLQWSLIYRSYEHLNFVPNLMKIMNKVFITPMSQVGVYIFCLKGFKGYNFLKQSSSELDNWCINTLLRNRLKKDTHERLFEFSTFLNQSNNVFRKCVIKFKTRAKQYQAQFGFSKLKIFKHKT